MDLSIFFLGFHKLYYHRLGWSLKLNFNAHSSIHACQKVLVFHCVKKFECRRMKSYWIYNGFTVHNTQKFDVYHILVTSMKKIQNNFYIQNMEEENFIATTKIGMKWFRLFKVLKLIQHLYNNFSIGYEAYALKNELNGKICNTYVYKARKIQCSNSSGY